MQSRVRKNSDQKTLFWLQNDIFFNGQVIVNKAALVWEKKKLEGSIQIKKRNNWRPKLLELFSPKFTEN